MTEKYWKRFWISCIFLLSISLTTNAQKLDTYQNITCFDISPDGTLYFYNGVNIIAWKNQKELFTYHTMGNHVFSIDVKNGFEILAFYEDQQSFQVFDNRLSQIIPTTSLNLPFWVDDIKQGVNNEYWVVSNPTQKLVKLRQNLTVLKAQSNPMFAGLQLLREQNGQLFAYDSKHVYVFSNNGIKLYEREFINLHTASVYETNFLLQLDKKINLLNLKNELLKEFSTLPVNPTMMMGINKELYFLLNGKLYVESL